MKKIGLIIGSFNPVRNGHLNMIKYGAGICDKLNVLVSATNPNDTFSSKLRFNWMKELLKVYKNVYVKLLPKVIPGFEYSSADASKVWAKLLKVMYPEVNTIISSEKYRDYLSEFMTTDENKVTSIIYVINRANDRFRSGLLECW